MSEKPGESDVQKRKCDGHRALQGAEWRLWKERCQVTEERELEKCALILKRTDDRRAFLQKYIKGRGDRFSLNTFLLWKAF